jgi:hypothetical protein
VTQLADVTPSTRISRIPFAAIVAIARRRTEWRLVGASSVLATKELRAPYRSS